MSKALQHGIRRFVGLLLVALILVMGMAGANPDLHRALHTAHCHAGSCEKSPESEPEDSDHICGVTLLQVGAIFIVDSPVIESLGTLAELVEHYTSKPFTVESFSLPQGRAPPIAGIV